MIVTCYVHRQKKLPRELAHQHHKIPQAVVKDDSPENLVYLCPDCHHALHQLATILRSGRTGMMMDILQQGYPLPQERSRILELANLVAESMVGKIEGETPTSTHLIPLILDHVTFLSIKRIANDHRRRGRPVGVARFISMLIQQEIRKRGFKV